MTISAILIFKLDRDKIVEANFFLFPWATQEFVDISD